MSSKQLAQSKLDDDPSDSDSEYYSDEDELSTLANTLVAETKAEAKDKHSRVLKKIRRDLKKRKVTKRGDGCPLILTNGKRAGHRCNKRLHRLRNGSFSTLCKYHYNRDRLEQRIASKFNNLPPPPPPVSLNDFVTSTLLSTTNLPPPPPPVSFKDFATSSLLPATNIPPPPNTTNILTANAPTTVAANNAGSTDAGGDTNMEDVDVVGLSQEELRKEHAEKEAQRETEEAERLLAEFMEKQGKRMEALKQPLRQNPYFTNHR